MLEAYRFLLVLGAFFTVWALWYEQDAVRDAWRDTKLLRAAKINGSARETAHTNFRNELRRAGEQLCLGFTVVVAFFVVRTHPDVLNFVGRGVVLTAQVLVLFNSRSARRLRQYIVANDLAQAQEVAGDH